MLIRSSALWLLSVAMAWSQLQTGFIQVDTTALNGSAGVAGVVDGVPAGKADQVRITVVRTEPAAPLTVASIGLAKDGTFGLTSLPPGTYRVCVQSSDGDFVDPCAWGLATPSVTVAGNQRIAAQRYSLTKGVRLKVRIDDPNGHLQQKANETVAPHILVGVLSPNGSLLPMVPTQANRAGLDYEMVIPLGTAIKFTTFSKLADLEDENRQLVPATGLFRDLPAVAAAAAPPSLRFTVRGRK